MREEVDQRNMEILIQFRNGYDVPKLAELYCLSEERIKAIVYGYGGIR
jgi:hypothetical protein